MHAVNLRATADPRHWGTKHPQSAYLWESAKHTLTLAEMEAGDPPTLEDAFASTAAFRGAYDFCREFFYGYLETLAERLNAMHGLDLPVSFWRTCVGTWLIRHISVAYDKFARLSTLDIDATDIVLLSPSSYFVPNDHYDYIHYFGNDPGVMQLVSQYYELFATAEFASVDDPTDPEERHYDATSTQASLILSPKNAPAEPAPQDYSSQGHRARVALCCAFYTEEAQRILSEKSGGTICNFFVPTVLAQPRDMDRKARALLAKPRSADPFERYFAHTMRHCTPRLLVEHFREYYDCYARHVEHAQHAAIVTECWTSFMPVSIYCAIARQHKGVTLVIQQHAACGQWRDCDALWLEIEIADTFLTVGWEADLDNCVAGGFATRDNKRYEFDAAKTDIVHVATTRFPYLVQFGNGSQGGLTTMLYLRCLGALLRMIPAELKADYLFRPRRELLHCDTDHVWEKELKGLRINAGEPLIPLMLRSKIVIVDHMSTALGELLINRIPFLLLHLEEFEQLSERHAHLFDELMACGVVHKTPESLLAHLARVGPDVRSWWQDDAVQAGVTRLADMSIQPGRKTIDFLLALAEQAR